MLKDREHIDNLFAEGLHDYEEKAPSYLWNNIQADIKQSKKVHRYSKIRAIAASVALLMTFGLGYLSSDYALRKKYEAKYLKGNKQSIIDSERSIRAEDSVSSITDDTVIIPVEDNEQNKTKIVANNTKIEDKGSQESGILYKLFNLSKEIFFIEGDNKLNTNQLAYEDKSSEENIPNQLLIDTLLLGKENLHEGGFLFNEKSKSKSNWSFGTKFSPVYSMAENNSDNSTVEQTRSLKGAVKDERPDTKTAEKSLLAFSGGVNVNYHLSKRWSLESGLFYSQRKQMAENLVGSSMSGYEEEMMVYTPGGERFVQSEVSNEANVPEVIGTSRDETYYSLNMDYISNFEYIELPLLVRYKIVDRKLGLDVLSGVSTNFLIGNKTSIISDDSDLWSGETDDVSPLLYNATLGLGLNYNFYRNFSFNLEPTFKYSIVPSSTSVVARYPYSFAVFAGFSYRFR